jgi:hypothetical protein
MVNLYKLSLPEGLGHGAWGIGHWGGSALDGFPGSRAPAVIGHWVNYQCLQILKVLFPLFEEDLNLYVFR